eukprot:52874-Eustigmatos_ZCMA.PRE.1
MVSKTASGAGTIVGYHAPQHFASGPPEREDMGHDIHTQCGEVSVGPLTLTDQADGKGRSAR